MAVIYLNAVLLIHILSIEINFPIFLFTELISSAVYIPPRLIHRIPDISYYASSNGTLLPFIAGGLSHAAKDNFFLYGVCVHGVDHPIYDSEKRMIVIRLADVRNFRMTPSIFEHYRPNFKFMYPPPIFD